MISKRAAVEKVKRYFYNGLCWIDIGLNVFFGGDYRETCSSRLGRYYGKVRAATMIADVIDWIALKVFGQADHCKVSIQCEHTRTAEVWR